MKTSSSSNDLTIIKCSKCNSHINQFSGKKRTICPFCGNLFEMYTNNYLKECNGISIPMIQPGNKKKSKSGFSWFRVKDNSKEDLLNRSIKPIVPLLTSIDVHSKANTNKNIPQSPRIESLFTENRRLKSKEISEFNQEDLPMDYFNDLIFEKKEKNDWQGLSELFASMFSTLKSIYFHFHKKNSNGEIQIDKLSQIHDYLNELPKQFQDTFMKSVENTVQNFNIFKYTNEEILGLIIVLLNSLFDKDEYFQVFALCMSTIISIHNRKDQQFVIRILIKLPSIKFQQLLRYIQNLLTYSLLANQENNRLKNKLFRSWKEKSVQFIALLYAANKFAPESQRLLHNSFYNCSIDHLNLSKDYLIWQDPHLNEFSFCQYPCVLSINAKKFIIQKESEQQMMFMAKESLISKMQQRQVPEFDMVFLNLSVRRSCLVSDSMNEILNKRKELKKKLKVKFIGEPGLDMGGLTKEWFLLLLRQILHARTSVFSYDQKSRLSWFHSVPSSKEHKEFYLTGVLMGLAVYNSINLDVKFPLLCYKKLLSPKLYMTAEKNIGICSVNLNDLIDIYPDLGNGLKELLTYDGDVENDICATFEIFYEDCYGNRHNHLLKENGSSIYVTADNRKEYVDRYCNFLLNSLIQTEFTAFYKGFHTVCDSNAFMLLQPEEIENLVCGNPVINLTDLKKVVVYDNYKDTDRTIILFWEVLLEFTESLQKLFLHFTTGSDKIPVGGVQELQFKISKANKKHILPVAYTCFNQLILPEYDEKNVLKLKLLIAMENSEGFGLQ